MGLKLKLLQGQIRTYEEAWGPHYDYPRATLWHWRNNGGTWTLLETALTSYFLQNVLCVIGKSSLAFSTFL